MEHMVEKFREIALMLNDAEVQYVVIGGLAMTLHGTDTVTQDIDISFARTLENTKRLAGVLQEKHARLRGLPDGVYALVDERTLHNTTNLTLETDIGPFDLLAEPAGVASFEHLWEQSVVLSVEGVEVHVASIADLIAMKRAANRTKDQAHILHLLALQKVLSGV